MVAEYLPSRAVRIRLADGALRSVLIAERRSRTVGSAALAQNIAIAAFGTYLAGGTAGIGRLYSYIPIFGIAGYETGAEEGLDRIIGNLRKIDVIELARLTSATPASIVHASL